MRDQEFGANTEYIAEAVAELMARLPGIRQVEDPNWVRRAFDAAAAARARGRGPASSD
jgi:hypothetical protein